MNIGIGSVSDLKGKNPERLYAQSNDLVGEIKNRGEDVSYVKIIATLYDKDDIVIGTDYTYTDPSDLRSGQRAPYDISLSDSDVDVDKIAKATYSLEWD